MKKEVIFNILNEVGLSPAEISVYIALLNGSESVQQIMRITNEKRPTVYYSLNSLEKRGLVSKSGKDYGNKFQVEPIEKLEEIIDANIRKQNDLLEKTKTLKHIFSTKKSTEKTIVSYFDTTEAIKSAIFFSLYGKAKVIRTIVPSENLFHEMGEDFIREYVNEKRRKSIKTKALWERLPDKKIINEYYMNAEIKQLPIDMHNSFKTTLFIYDDKTLYISPKKENHAVLIQSTEHAKMMISVFENIWNHAINI
ncbi:ArsR family transcriptional regulator [Candidatus Falkowbacteria bacterium]|nr:ArsR family transcriptional regulator [Candidatus Falkowbacteria bacterium]